MARRPIPIPMHGHMAEKLALPLAPPRATQSPTGSASGKWIVAIIVIAEEWTSMDVQGV
jgi:hypothetical protein